MFMTPFTCLSVKNSSGQVTGSAGTVGNPECSSILVKNRSLVYQISLRRTVGYGMMVGINT